MSVCCTRVDAAECMSEHAATCAVHCLSHQPVEETKAAGTDNLSFHLACAASERSSCIAAAAAQGVLTHQV